MTEPSPSSTPAPVVAAPGATLHIDRAMLDDMRARSSPLEIKEGLVATFLECALATPLTEAPPDPFGPYVGLVKLGQGGMAEVYQVRDPSLGHDVALKVMLPQLARDREYILRFLREASNTALVSHHNVVQLHGLGAIQGRLYFSLELIQGENLKERMAKGRIPPRESLEILRQVLEGLIAAHEEGIGHRDLKPANIMLTTNAQSFGYDLADECNTIVKVTDFGLARLHGGDIDAGITQEGQFLGTAKYVAPELIRGTEPTLQSDIFSLGIMAFQMFAGAPCFRVRKRVDYIEANLNEEPPLVHEVAPEIAPGIGLLVDAMLRKDPMERPTADVLLRDLRRLERMGPNDYPDPSDDPNSVFHGDPQLSLERRYGSTARAAHWLDHLDARVVIALFLGSVLFLIGVLLWPKSQARPEVPDLGQRDIDSEADRLPALDDFPELVLPPLSKLSKRRREALRAQLVRGDQAWRDGRAQEALDAWRKASQARQLKGLSPRLRAARSRLAEDRIRQAADERRWRDLEELCAAAEQSAPLPRELRELRARARRHAEAEEAAREALSARSDAKARALLARVDIELLDADARATIEARRAELDEAPRTTPTPTPRTTPTPTPRTTPTSTPDPARADRPRQPSSVQPGDRARIESYLDRAQRGFESQDLVAVERALRDLARLRPPPAAAKPVRRWLEVAQSAPTGYVFLPPTRVTLFGTTHSVSAIYVTRAPVSNEAWRGFLEARSLAPPSAWRGGAPTTEPEDPVQGVRVRHAKLYAEARNQALPNRVERLRIDRALRLERHGANRPDSDGRFPDGFRIIEALPDLPAWPGAADR